MVVIQIFSTQVLIVYTRNNTVHRDPEYIEGVASSLVREYLSRKGLKETLKALEYELPRCEYSISNRPKLMKTLHLERLMKRNKEQDTPLRAMIEVITKHYLEKNGRSGSAVTDSRDSLSADDRSQSAGLDVSELSLNERSRRHRHERYETKSLDRPKHAKDKMSLPSSAASGREVEEPCYYDTQSLDRRHKSRERDAPVVPEGGFFAMNEQSSSYEKTRKDSSSTRHNKYRGAGQSHSNDLMIEDDLDSETIVGQGRAGLIERIPSAMPEARKKKDTSRPLSSRHRGLGGPIRSNLDARDKRRLSGSKSGSRSRAAALLSDEVAVAAVSSEKCAVPSGSRADSRADSTVHGNDIPSYPSFPDQPASTNSLRDVIEPPIISNERLRIKEGPSSISDLLENARKNKVKMKRQSRRVVVNEDVDLDDDSSSYDLENSSISTDKVPTRSMSLSSKEADIELGDLDDVETELGEVYVGPNVMAPVKIAQPEVDSTPIDLHTAIRLKKLIFGSALQSFNDGWRCQSFAFSDIPGLQYGIVQKKGGPCGVLASIQACVLQELLFGDCRKPSTKRLEPRRTERSDCLAVALTNVLWHAGEDRQAVVALPGRRTLFTSSSKFKGDGLIETLILYKFKKYEELRDFIKQNVSQFEMEGMDGVILALYSVIFSRSIEKVLSDMDEPTNKLMGAHGYCSQDMVNLFLCGQAVSNVFNDTVELSSAEGSNILLKGITGRCNVGLLSLFEHYKSCQVGTFLKTPKFPIWVVCSESHFSVLFAVKRELMSDWKAERRFDLYYYDGLSRQDEQIRLTIDTTNQYFQPPGDDDLVPPLELCIRTKWSGAEINWNGTEPLL